MKIIENIKNDYNDKTFGGTEWQFLAIAGIIIFLPSIMVEHSKYKIVRLFGLILSIALVVPTLPISMFFLLIGFFQIVWQEI